MKAERWEERKEEGWQGWGALDEIKNLILIQKILLSDETLVDSSSHLPDLFLCVILVSLLCVCGWLENQVTELQMKHPSSRAREKKPFWFLI